MPSLRAFRPLLFFLGWILAQCEIASLVSAQEWTRFRGPNGTGISNASQIPTKFSLSDANWRIQLPGVGHSHPVIWGDKLFLTSAVEASHSRQVLCYQASDGKLLWKTEYPYAEHHRHQFNSFASATAAVDETHVYVAFTTPEEYMLVALKHDGTEAWRADLGPFESQHSGGTSPVVFENLVVIGNEQDGPSFLAAFDRMTGKEAWRTPRKFEKVAYSTPCIYQPAGQPPQMIFNSQAYGVSAVDPYTGRMIWEAPLLSMRSCSSPVLAGGNLIGSCGSGAGGNYLIAIKPGGTGNISSTNLAYKLTRSMPYVPTPIAVGDLLFAWSDGGVVTCIQADTGEQHWQKRVEGNYFGSPICVQDRLYCISTKGKCVVLRASKTFEELAVNDLGEGSHSTPAVANERMYLRTFSHLISIGGKKE